MFIRGLPGRIEVMHGEPSDSRMLPDIDGGADEALPVHEVVEGEGEVRRLLKSPLGTVERLDVPSAQTDKVARQQISEN